MECSPTNALPLELKGVSREVGVSGGSGRVWGQWACLWTVGVSLGSGRVRPEQSSGGQGAAGRASFKLPSGVCGAAHPWAPVCFCAGETEWAPWGGRVWDGSREGALRVSPRCG